MIVSSRAKFIRAGMVSQCALTRRGTLSKSRGLKQLCRGRVLAYPSLAEALAGNSTSSLFSTTRLLPVMIFFSAMQPSPRPFEGPPRTEDCYNNHCDWDRLGE